VVKVKSKKNKIIKHKFKKTSKNIKGGNLIIHTPLFSTATVAGAPIATNIVLGKTNEILNPTMLTNQKPFV